MADINEQTAEQIIQKQRLFIKVTRDSLPQVKDKYPFIYLERGRLEVDDASVKWIDSDGAVVRLPIATINTLLLGPGTSITHEAVKVMAAANCSVCWVGEDSLLFYAAGHIPTATTCNMRTQMLLAADNKKAEEVARRMFAYRFPKAELAGKNLKSMMGMEGYRVKQLYAEMAEKYKVGWKGREYLPGKMVLSDITNKILTSANAALYGIITSAIYALGYSPHIGFVHSGSPLPFVYDIADLYKENLCIDLAFKMTLDMGGDYNKYKVATAFKDRVLKIDLLGKIATDIEQVLGSKNVSSNCE
ncbi:MAG: type I-E CRISPR-associated endonuclease Cas1e [Bacillota bacterium]